jgi:uncharacterized protein YukE
MSTLDVHVDPDRLRAIAEELSMFSNDVKAELIVLNSELAKLGRSWQDEEYKKFKDAIQPLHRILEQFHEEITRSKPAMLADAEAIRAYQKLQTP